MNDKTSINFGPPLHNLADSVAKSAIQSAAQTGEYGGIGGHGVQTHHGTTHSQVGIKIGNQHVTIRKTQ